MAELTLRERLQPALLDRLTDDERVLTVFTVAFDIPELERLGLTERNLIDIITTRGPRLIEPEVARSRDPSGERVLQFSAAAGRVSLSQLKAFVVRPPNAPQGVPLGSLCRIEGRNALNETQESAERRHISARRLREFVCRDVAALLNAMSPDVDEVGAYSHVQSSVLNYGMPSLAGRPAHSIDMARTALAIEEVLRRFEPRLTKVRVLPDTDRTAAGDGHQLGFRIEAELWGNPLPQQLVLRTKISTESGDVSVVDSGAK